MEEEFEDITSDIGWILITFLSLINEIVDWIGILFNLTGVWTVIVFILNLITLFFIFVWRVTTEGFSLSAIFGSWKQFIWLILEHIPIIGDIIPGWLLFMWGIRKKKIPKPTPKS